MRRSRSKSRTALLFMGLALFFTAPALIPAGTYDLDLSESVLELRPGLTTTAWAYNGLVPGTPIVASPGERLIVRVRNRLSVPTNIHWHGLEVPNDQDGPAVRIEPGASHTYDFTVNTAGTYWYHSHQQPVLDQVDMGLYGALIVRDPADEHYSGDHVLVLDDWFLDTDGARLPGTARGGMERLGNVESVNGKSGAAIEPLRFARGELHKLRFINASTAAVHTLTIREHAFRVTHTDGRPLAVPYLADTLTLSPGERIDAEVAATGTPGSSYEIRGDRPELGLRLPIAYSDGEAAPVPSPHAPPQPHALSGAADRPPDALLTRTEAW